MRSAEVRKEKERGGGAHEKREKEQALALCPFEKGRVKMKREGKELERVIRLC